jgi:hypothetical protein
VDSLLGKEVPRVLADLRWHLLAAADLHLPRMVRFLGHSGLIKIIRSSGCRHCWGGIAEALRGYW